jgi:hypothetical protein
VNTVKVSTQKVYDSFEKLDMTGEGADGDSFNNMVETMSFMKTELKRESEVIFRSTRPQPLATHYQPKLFRHLGLSPKISHKKLAEKRL